MKAFLLCALLSTSISYAADAPYFQMFYDIPVSDFPVEVKKASYHDAYFETNDYSQEVYAVSKYYDSYSDMDGGADQIYVRKIYRYKVEGMSFEFGQLTFRSGEKEILCGEVKGVGGIFNWRKELVLNGRCKLRVQHVETADQDERAQFYLKVKK